MELTRELVREYFQYDESIKGLVRIKNVQGRCRLGERFGSKTAKGYVRGRFAGRDIFEHKLVFLYHYGYIPKMIDHINRSKDDNRIENLREADSSLNAINTGIASNNTTGYKGVTFDIRSGKYMARIKRQGVSTFLGRYATAELAANAIEEHIDGTKKEEKKTK